MDRKTATIVGAAAALASGPALASPAPAEPAVPPVASYADLLQPIPNAVERLRLADANDTSQPARLIKAQYHHHHHHHHHHSRRWYLQHGYYWQGGVWMLRPPRNHHHHHHHQQDNHHHHDHN